MGIYGLVGLKRDGFMTDEKEKLQAELEWVSYRIKMLDIMKRKLYEMKGIAERASGDIDPSETMELNKKIKYLESQVTALDNESLFIKSL